MSAPEAREFLCALGFVRCAGCRHDIPSVASRNATHFSKANFLLKVCRCEALTVSFLPLYRLIYARLLIFATLAQCINAWPGDSLQTMSFRVHWHCLGVPLAGAIFLVLRREMPRTFQRLSFCSKIADEAL